MQRFDAIVVGAGFAGMHMLWKLRQLNMSVLGLERNEDVGGTWLVNRYPGCRCDVESFDYSAPWDPELDQDWEWSERYALQPELNRYLSHIADRHDLRRDIKFNSAVERMTWDQARQLWVVKTSKGDTFEARFVISAAGALSDPNIPDIPGIKDFKGELYHTARWPREPVTLKGKRVAVLGTGSTGVQASTAIAAQADHLYVLQRTAQFSLPCSTPKLFDEDQAAMKARYPEHREWQRKSYGATHLPLELPLGMRAFDDTKEKRRENYEKCWNAGAQTLVGVYADVSSNAEVNEEVSNFARDKIREIIKDPAVAEKLCPPPGHYIGTRRIVLDTGYFQIFNQPNVTIVDITNDPIVEITVNGVKTRDAFYEIDILVVATGYDAVTGPLMGMNITGKNGAKLADRWADGPHSYFGLISADFPNFFTINGPGSPSVLVNVVFSIAQHVDWIGDCLTYLRENGIAEIDTTPAAENEWGAFSAQVASRFIRMGDDRNWYLGTNIPGKARGPLAYHGGLIDYGARIDEAAANNYRGFVLTKETAPSGAA